MSSLKLEKLSKQALRVCLRRSYPIALGSLMMAADVAVSATFTPLVPLPTPKVLSSSEHFDGGWGGTNLFDSNLKTEFATLSKGTNASIELDFAAPSRFAAFRHVDRNDVATVAESELVFSDADGHVVSTVTVPHVNKRGGETFFVIPSPALAQKVKWRVTKLGNRGAACVGGAELTLFTSEAVETSPRRDRVEAGGGNCLERQGELGVQPISLGISHFYSEPTAAVLRVDGQEARPVSLKPGTNTFEWKLPAVQKETAVKFSLECEGATIATTTFQQRPPRPLTVYVLPHSHTDIGYTEIQSEVETKQVNNLVEGIAAARRTATYPKDARFIWNVEVLWAADLYLKRLNEQQRADFFEAVKKGHVVLNGMYLNELTGLCRPEELVQLFRFATVMSEQTGVPIQSAMISDVPGFTWGVVPAMAQAGIKYFSAAPNYFDRIGNILVEWENKPFYWVGPDGKSKVLVWIPFWGYAMSHVYTQMSPKLVDDFYTGLTKANYPYDIAYVRWSGHGDNAVPDPTICDFIKDWNAKYVWPHFVISGTDEAFQAFEKQYGSKLPVVHGDWTPYWEDGAGSSALETMVNRQSSDRLIQAQTLFAMRNPSAYPQAAFEEAWNNVLLYSEHTWGAWCSVSDPERKETKEQWAVKKSYVDMGDQQSRQLLSKAVKAGNSTEGLDVYNTLSWPRTELVTISAELSKAGDRVADDRGRPMPSQRLASGELVFLAKDVPPLATKRYTVSAGAPAIGSRATAEGTILNSGVVSARVDPITGGIVELTLKGMKGNLVDTSENEALNDYVYLQGDNVKNIKRNGQVKIFVGEKGPLVASLIIESEAPGCNKLRRELRVVAGQDYIEIINLVDKARLQAKNYKDVMGKESVNFAFPFNVPEGQMVLDIPLGTMRPEDDQIPSACKNWLTVGRWADVSNLERGVTWVTLDAPLIEVGGITATLLNSQTNPDVWRKTIARTQKFYSWAMNNHWGTNYRAYQEGPTVFRFILRPHRKSGSAEATRFATGFSQPMLVERAGQESPSKPLLEVSSPDLLVIALKPSEDGKAWIVRLFNASDKDKSTKLKWSNRRPKTVFVSDTSEKPGSPVSGAIHVGGYGLVTLRAEFE